MIPGLRPGGRAVSLGATRLELAHTQSPDHVVTALLDPPGPRPLPASRRLPPARGLS